MNIQASRFTEMKEFRVLGTTNSKGVVEPAPGLPELIEAKFPSAWESYVRRLTHVLGLLSSGEGVPANFMSEGFAHYVNAGWEARTSLYAFYCARINILETWNFISPASLIVLLRGVIEAEHKTLVKRS